MTRYDVFNGDADGVCALHQLRLAEPADTVLVTGVKRDIALVERVPEQGTEAVTVLDVSLEKNRDAVDRLLGAGIPVTYFDHHFPGELPTDKHFGGHIDTDATTCTGLIVDAHLDGAHRPWAVVAAFGDNLHDSARAAAAPLELGPDALARLEALGTLLNYNGYGASVSDLYFAPDALYRRIAPYADPFAFIAEDEAFRVLEAGYADDIAEVEGIAPEQIDEHTALFVLPDAPFARRVSGVFANRLASDYPERAHAMLSCKADGSYLVSVRAPLARREGADTLCRQFDTGGGRRAAAGINRLPSDDYERFLQAFRDQYADD